MATEDKRWIARVTYLSMVGPVMVEHYIEELGELEDLVERGPHWDTIDEIKIELNPSRRTFTGTVEEAMKL